MRTHVIDGGLVRVVDAICFREAFLYSFIARFGRFFKENALRVDFSVENVG